MHLSLSDFCKFSFWQWQSISDEEGSQSFRCSLACWTQRHYCSNLGHFNASFGSLYAAILVRTGPWNFFWGKGRGIWLGSIYSAKKYGLFCCPRFCTRFRRWIEAVDAASHDMAHGSQITFGYSFWIHAGVGAPWYYVAVCCRIHPVMASTCPFDWTAVRACVLHLERTVTTN